ncbi:hypothetical protein ACLMJK_008012 [Lecanora helva]
MVLNDSASYFARFPNFIPDARLSLLVEFDRLATFQGWIENGWKYGKERRLFLLAHYNEHLGGVEQSKYLRDWQALCTELGVKPMPESINKCKNTLSTKVHVNLIDLIESRRSGIRVRTFKSRGALHDHTIAKGKYFPLDVAKKNGLVKILLREMN